MPLQLVVLVPFLLSSSTACNFPTSNTEMRHDLGLVVLVPRLHSMLPISFFFWKKREEITRTFLLLFLIILIFSPSATSHMLNPASRVLLVVYALMHTYSRTSYWQDNSSSN